MTITFFVPSIPRGQSRPRFTQQGHAYKSKEQQLDEQRLMALFMEHRPPEPLNGPLKLSIVATYPIPSSKSRKWQEGAKSGLIMPCVKPDLSNVVKGCEDCMAGIFFLDDKQICQVRAVKRYGAVPG